MFFARISSVTVPNFIDLHIGMGVITLQHVIDQLGSNIDVRSGLFMK